MEYLNDLDSYLKELLPEALNPTFVVDDFLQNLKPWQIVFVSLVVYTSIWFAIYLLKTLTAIKWKKLTFRLLRKIPFVARKISEEFGKTVGSMHSDITSQVGDLKYNKTLPQNGWNTPKVLEEVSKCMKLATYKVDDGSISGTCHIPTDIERVKAVTETYKMTAYANPLNPDAYPGIRKMEAEVVRMAINLFNGDGNACGTMTSGGTESLILACKAYRGYAREEKGIVKPNIVMSKSGHVGFHKGAHLLGMEVRLVPMDPVTMQPDLNKFRKTIDSNTVMLVASAPQYPHGVMDPIVEIGAIAKKRNIPLHVDGCLGGFLIVFMKKAGFDIDPFDFRVEGVTSISADTHKFGYAPKGSSLVMYSDRKYIHHQYYVAADWSGGIFISPTLAGSRSGGIIAATWACMMNHGLDGYVEATRKVVSTLQYIVKGIRNIDGLEVMGDPKSCIVAFKAKTFHIYSLADEMKDRGWLLQTLQFPSCVHFYVTPMHTKPGIKERFVNDLEQSAKKHAKLGMTNLEGRAAMYGMAQSLPDRGLVDELAHQFIDALYTTDE